MNIETLTEEIRNGAHALGVEITPDAAARLARFAELLARANESMNLTAVPEVEYLSRHFLDSLSTALAPQASSATTLIDVGTGAGFPGIPLALWRPDLQVTLVESVEKKSAFIRSAISELGISNVQVITNRAETLGREPEHRERYDLAVARAVAPLRELLEYLLPLVRAGGAIIALKGPDYPAEIDSAENALHQFDASIADTTTVQIPGSELVTTLITIEKRSPLPDRFPRTSAAIQKRPL